MGVGVGCEKVLFSVVFTQGEGSRVALYSNSDQHQFSPYDIHKLSRAKSLRINKIITK